MLVEPMDVFERAHGGVQRSEGAVSRSGSPTATGRDVVNEAGSLNFNNLNTHDANAAKSFYGAVFGWGTMSMGGGAEAWTLPGYGDHLERLNPGTRERWARWARRAVSSTWSRRSRRFRTATTTYPALGRDVRGRRCGRDRGEGVRARRKDLAPPFDAPWVRMTIIADPQGATFIASQFVPENRDVATPGSESLSAA